MGIIVENAPRTLMAHKPEFYHATSVGHRVSNAGISVVFSQRLANMWLQEEEIATVITSAEGAGNNDHGELSDL